MSSQTFSTFSEVGMIDGRSQNGSITLPLTTDIPYRILTLKDIYGAASVSSITLTTQGADVFEDGTTSRLLNGAFETTTLYAGQAGYWYVIGGSRLATAAIGTLSTGIIANPLRLGTLSTQTAIQFPGIRSNYTGTVITGQTTGVGTQELLLYQASSISDQIRLQTTGNIVFEAGAAARSWPSTSALATPTLYIAGSTSNVGIGTVSPATTLDVAGGGRFQTLSTVSLNVSSINGIIPGAAFIGSTNFISATTVQAQTVSTQAFRVSSINGVNPVPLLNGSTTSLSTAAITTSSLVATQITTRNLTLNGGSQTINFNGSSNTIAYGTGVDTLSLKSQSAGFGGGIASLFFGNATSAYPLGRIAAVDSASSSAAASALIFQTATAAANAGLSGTSVFNYTGSNQSYTVPAGVTSITLSMWGAGGGGGSFHGGPGAYAKGTLAVTAGQILTILVGQGGTTTGTAVFGGGGLNSTGEAIAAGSGGGRSAIRRTLGVTITGSGVTGTGSVVTYPTSAAHGLSLNEPVIITGLSPSGYNGTFVVASIPTPTSFTVSNTTSGGSPFGSGSITSEVIIIAGGGGGGSDNSASSGSYGGYGGLTNGGGGLGYGSSTGRGGTQSAGGAGGGTNGSLLLGGNGFPNNGFNGPGGGGGFYGGGGGWGWWGLGGGGGSSYLSNLNIIESGETSSGRLAPGSLNLVYLSGVANGNSNAAGGNGLVVIETSPAYMLSEAMRIDTNAYVGIGMSNPSTLLDVAGTGRFQSLSTLSLNISTINGQTTSQLAAIPIQSTVIGLGSAGYVSSLVNVPLVSSQQINVSTLNVVYLSSSRGYISSLRTDNLTVGGTDGYVTIQDLITGTVSTGQLLAGAGFISSLQINSLSFGPSGYVIVGDVIANSLSTKKLNTQALYANNIYVGNNSTQSAILFPGVDGNFKGTAISEQVTGVGTEELLLYKVSTTSDQIRLQTTGNIVFEAGASARSWPSTQTLATPTLYIQGSSSNVGIGTAAPATTLDVVGTGRFLTLSTYTLNVSSVNGILPGAAFNGSTLALSTGSLYASNVVVKNNGSLTSNQYGPGIDTLSIQTPNAGFSGGIASLYFGASNSTYPLARIGALDQGLFHATSALVFQTATPNNASLLTANTFAYTGSNQTFTVPVGVTSITVYAWGAGGGGKNYNGGAGAMIQGVLTVTPGEVLNILVGGGGSAPTTTVISAYGGGGAAGTGDGGQAGGGGGRTAIQRGGTAVTNDIVVAGGGGGGTYSATGGSATFSGTANNGGGNSSNGGSGGTQSAGGAGGAAAAYGTGLPGSRGQGGSVTSGDNSDGGGGGGGYYGGGGGSTNTLDLGGGGGGSSFTGNLSVIPGQSVLGFNSINGFSAPNTSSPYYSAGVAVGTLTAGGNGLLVITYNSPFSLTETMRIHSNTYIGIGTANPQALLHVSGMTYSIETSTQALTISTINGQTTSQLAAIPIQSTVIGLGTAGYVSTPQLAATSNYFQNLLFLNVSSAISTATLYTSNTSNFLLPALSNNLSSAASTLGLYTSNTSNYFQNLLALNISSGISTATLFTSNTSNFILSTNQSSISTAFITANQGFISSLTVNSLAIGSNSGFINMGDIITTSISSLQINTGVFTGSELIVSSMNGQQPLTIQNLTSTVAGTNSNISSMIDPTELTSTVTGLGTANFISTVGLTTILNSTVTGVNTTIAAMIDPVELASSITGLGTTGFISSLGLDAIFASTTQGLGTATYLSSGQLVSTVIGLGSAGYISSTQLFSTVRGIGSGFTGSTIGLSAGAIFASSISTIQFWAQNVNTQAVSTNALIFGSGTGTLLMPDIAPNTVYASTVTASNIQIGWTSNQSPLQFYGYGTYSNSVIVEQSTGTTSQELFVFRGSNAADRIRFQTTGYMAIETGVSSRLYTAALSNATPAVMIDINSNVGIRLAAPAFPLDVGGIARAITLSSLTLQTSTIEGAIFTRDLYANARTLLQGEVSTPFLLGNYNTLSFRTAGIQRATFTQAGNLGIGIAAPQFPVDIAGITRVSTIYNSTSISYNFISAPLLVASTVNTENAQITNISTNQINASMIYGRWNDAQYYVLQTL